ncbi:MAG: hypothetical protein NTV21_05320 [Planctomycetota bacterium]|nr:hypothetical protein [Planctomycetota bacterium]
MKKLAKRVLSEDQVTELVCQALEHELGGVQIYRMALKCVQNDELREEWQEFSEATATHVEKLEEDEHLYHPTGWARELWFQSLGMRAVLPPPEETRHVKSTIGAARAKQAAGR